MRGDGAVKDVDGDWPPKDKRVVGDDDGFDFPLQGREVPLAESLRRRAKVLLLTFLLETAALRAEIPPIFSRSK